MVENYVGTENEISAGIFLIQHGKRDEPLCHVRPPGSGLGIRRTCNKDGLPFADQQDIRIRKTGDPIRI